MQRNYCAAQAGRAIYLVAGQSAGHTIPHRAVSSFRAGELPTWLSSLADLDFLDPGNPFFHTDRALFSYGQFIDRPTPPGIFNRRRGQTTILGDSGGYQLIEKPKLWQGDKTRAEALNWLESNTDEAMTLDIPTRAIGRNSSFPDFETCLAVTLDNNAYFHAHKQGGTRFLSVLQGRDSNEARQWYEAVAADPFDGGWALGGTMRTDLIYLVGIIHRLRGDGLLGSRDRLHILGTSTLIMGVMLSALQKSVRKLAGQEEFQITFDTANPSHLGKYGRLYGDVNFTSFTHLVVKPPTRNDYDEVSRLRWPVRNSRISELAVIGDLIRSSIGRNAGTDALGNALIVHHNTDAMLHNFDLANSVLEMPSGYAANIAPPNIVRAYNHLLMAFVDHEGNERGDPVAHMTRERKLFAGLKLHCDDEEDE